MPILIIEDDSKTRRALQSGLKNQGFEVVSARNGEEGLLKLEQESFDLVVLDWMLPDHDGIEILKKLRSEGNQMPVLLLTAKDAIENRVTGLESGADDYLIKPFAFAELAARVKTLLRRASSSSDLCKRLADLTVDLSARRVTRHDRSIELTPREFDVLVYLINHAGQIVTRDMLARDVWRETNRITPLDNVIDVHFANLRRKIDEGQNVRLIHTVRGVGFVMKEESVV